MDGSDADPELAALVAETKRALKTLQRVSRTAVQLTASLEARLTAIDQPRRLAEEAERERHPQHIHS